MVLECRICGEKFSQQSSHSRHQSTCGKENIHQCKTCSNSFKRKDSTKRHVLKCSPKPKTFECHVCGNSFDAKWKVNRHIKNVHERSKERKTKRHPCNSCDKMFVDRGSLLKHIQSKHKEAPKKSHNDLEELNRMIKEFVNSDVQEVDTSYDSGDEIIDACEEDRGEISMVYVDQVVPDIENGNDDNCSEADIEINEETPSNPLDHLQENIRKKKLSRYRKCRLTKKISMMITKVIEEAHCDDEDELSVKIGVMKRLGINSSHFKNARKEETRRRKKTPLETRLKVWEFWHSSSSVSTITSRPAKLRVDSIPYLHTDLPYHDGIKKVTNKRNVQLLESPWRIIEKTVRQLHQEYNETHSDTSVSLGTFLSLRPFYIRSPSSKDIEMCLCKDHLHARWAIEALLKLTKQQGISTTFDSYESFFQTIYSLNCCTEDESCEYIKWTCTPDKGTICQDITDNFNLLKDSLMMQSDDGITIKMLYFERQDITTAKGKVVKKLKPVPVKANIQFVMNFIENLLSKIIHHRNLLKNYRSNIAKVISMFNTVSELWVDFSENLTVPVKKEPQSLYYSKVQKSIHSGITKQGGCKIYHPYVSDDLRHDQAFVFNVLDNMMQETDIKPESTAIIISDNCSSQYKSVQNFYDLKKLAHKFKITIIRIYGIPGHGKNEIDCVGGVIKIALRRAVTTGEFFDTAACCVDYLCEKFADSDSPPYCVKEVFPEELDKIRKDGKYTKHGKVSGSSKFRIMVFEPDQDIIKTAPYLCVCEKCENCYGSCELFDEHSLESFALNVTSLRSNYIQTPGSAAAEDGDEDEIIDPDFYAVGTICAVAADKESIETFYFVYIEDECEAEFDIEDDFHMQVKQGQTYLSGFYLEKSSSTAKRGLLYEISKKRTVFFFPESIVYPFVNFEQCLNMKKNRLMITNEHYCEILCFVEETKMSAIV